MLHLMRKLLISQKVPQNGTQINTALEIQEEDPKFLELIPEIYEKDFECGELEEVFEFCEENLEIGGEVDWAAYPYNHVNDKPDLVNFDEELSFIFGGF